jgi:acyl carrier protein
LTAAGQPAGNPVEVAVAGIWRALLPDAATLGVSDNVFGYGANSLTAVQFIGRVAEEFGVTLAIHQVFNQPTVAELARTVADLVADPGAPTSPGGAQAEPVSGGAEHPQRFPAGAQAEPVSGGAEHPQRFAGVDELSDDAVAELLRVALARRRRRAAGGGTG